MNPIRAVVIGDGLVGTAAAAALGERVDVSEVVLAGRSASTRNAPREGVRLVDAVVGSGVSTSLVRDGDVVVLAVGPAAPRASLDEAVQLISQTLTPVVEVVDAVSRLESARLVLVSSGGAVYGTSEQMFSEDDVASPQTPYGVAKLAEEMLVGLIARRPSVDVVRLRVATVYGRRREVSDRHGLVQLAVDRALAGKTISLIGDGRARRGYVAARDLGDVIGEVGVASAPAAVYNVCGGHVHSGREVIEVVEQVTRRRVEVDTVPGSEGDVVLDSARLAADFPHLSFRPLRDGVTDLVAESERHPTLGSRT